MRNSDIVKDAFRGAVRMLRPRGTGSWMAIGRLGLTAGWPVIALAVGVNALIGLSPVVFVIATSAMISDIARLPAHPGSVVSGDVLTAFVIALVSLVVQSALAPAQAAVGELVTRRADGACTRDLMALGLHDAPLAVLEEQEVLDGLADVRMGLTEAFASPGSAVAGMLALVARYAQLIADIVIVGVVLGPVACVVMAVTAAVVRGGQRGSMNWWTEIFTGFLGKDRQARYVVDTGSGTEIAKEMRLLNLLPWYSDRAERQYAAYLGDLWRERRRVYFGPFLIFMVVGLAGGVWSLLLLRDAVLSGTTSVLGLALVIQAVVFIVKFGVYFPEADVQTELGMRAHGNLAKFRERCMTGVRQQAGRPAVADGSPRDRIRFENVKFAYPGSERLVLDGLDLEITAGQSTAIVGLNGAGKTTLVKLLAGLYEPSAGRVTVDGAGLNEVDTRSWQRQLAAIFQDYVRYELDAGANIGLGAPARLGDAAALAQAAEAAGAADVVAGLPSGLGTPLSSSYAGGVDLSGGQWQRVALARALFAVQAGAKVLILDEPTAQLDVRAEVEFFDRFLDLTRGLTTVIISHRFSSVRRADRIVVLEEGRITAQGSHEELMSADGEYARLFRLQAQRFSVGGNQVDGTEVADEEKERQEIA
jgi:ATP-binding cassette subfamily B protein